MVIRQILGMAERQAWLSCESLELGTYKSESSLQADPSRELDLEYLSLRTQILESSYFGRMGKHLRIRLCGWLQKLDQIISNALWRRNRNTYAKLIDLMCDCEVVVPPFHALPPAHDLPKLSRHEVNSTIDQIERQLKLKVGTHERRAASREKSGKQARVKPEEHWQRVRKEKRVEKENFGEVESIFLGKLTSLEEKTLHLSKINRESSINKVSASLKPKHSNIYHSDIKGKDSFHQSQQFDFKTSSKLTKSQARPPKQIAISLNAPLHASSKPPPINSEQEQKTSCLAFRDAHVSVQLENQTLKTEMFDDLSIHPPGEQDFLLSEDDCDYSSELSERTPPPCLPRCTPH